MNLVSTIFLFLGYLNVCLPKEVKIWGPGLQPQKIIMPARYFFVNFTSFYGKWVGTFRVSVGSLFKVIFKMSKYLVTFVCNVNTTIVAKFK